jgi:GNAT superfamily N-acetyltransferase
MPSIREIGAGAPLCRLSMLTIRAATVDDAALISRFIRELAEYANELHHAGLKEADLARDGFGADPQFHALIADWHSQPAGFALFFRYYSTWRGAGLYLEDLFVRPAFRRRGIGSALLARVAAAAEEQDCIFIRWAVLRWNEPAMGLYKAVRADFLDDWRTVLLSGDGLRRLAQRNV